MARFAIATSIYSVEPSFIADYVTGLQAAAKVYGGLRLLAAVEHGFDAERALRALPPAITLELHSATTRGTPAALRGALVKAAARSDVDVVVFADFDDQLLPGALDLHSAALAHAEISYGDMELIDGQGRAVGRRWLDGTDIPEQIAGPKALARRNFIGFSNSAVRRAALAVPALNIPDNLVAADWWFFTMLLAGGLRARRTTNAVARYRVYAQNTLGADAAASADALRLRARIAASHYDAITGAVDVASERRAVANLLARIESDTSAAVDIAAKIKGRAGAWFEDVDMACRLVEPASATANSA